MKDYWEMKNTAGESRLIDKTILLTSGKVFPASTLSYHRLHKDTTEILSFREDLLYEKREKAAEVYSAEKGS